MKIIGKYKNKEKGVLTIYETGAGNLVGEVDSTGKNSGKGFDMRATFYRKYNEATEYRVCEYFGFNLADKIE